MFADAAASVVEGVDDWVQLSGGDASTRLDRSLRGAGDKAIFVVLVMAVLA